MRKIISILVALGMILALSVMAVPTAAQAPCATVTATVPPFCAGGTDTYTIAFTAPATLLLGNDLLSATFAAGTTFGTFVAGDITVNTINVDVTKVVKSGNHIEFPTPLQVNAGIAVTVVIAKVINPAVAGEYDLCLDYKLSCCAPVDFCCVKYTIAPAISTYDFSFDFSPTYPGLVAGFVPPFKACGQDDTVVGAEFDTELIGGKWYNQFDLDFGTIVLGCATPCANVTVTVALVTAPVGANVSLSFNGTWISLTPAAPGPASLGVVVLATDLSVFWDGLIHVDTVGDYVICFYADCGAPPPCSEGGGVIASECMEFHAYQWKDAYRISLYRKWNLISLPVVPFDTDIADILAAYPGVAEVDSIWNYNAATATWSTWDTGPTGLTTMVDGKAYWVKVDYSLSDPLKAPGLLHGYLWVWGNVKPVPPLSPSAYPVSAGWNMVGLTEVPPSSPMLAATYLWNLTYGAVYGWTASTQSYALAPSMVSGNGYWVSFPGAGTIYPP